MKRKTQITSMVLNTPTFHGESFHPGVVNFIYGKNGSGKSTLANAIVSKEDVEWAKGCDPGIEILIYNEEYRLQNISQVDGMPAVFTFSKENGDIQRKIEELTSEIESTRRSRMDSLAKVEEYDHKMAKAEEEHARIVMGLATELKEKFPKVFGKPEEFVKLVDAAVPKKQNEEALRYMYEAAENDVEYEPYHLLKPYLIEENPLMGMSIVNLGDSEYAYFIKTLGAMDWIRQGHDAFSGKAKKMCPYCGQGLPDGFEEKYQQCFDDQYKKDIAKLEAFIEEYQEMLETLGQEVKANMANEFGMGPVGAYKQECLSLVEVIQESMAILERKKKNPAEALFLPVIAPLLSGLDKMALEINANLEQITSYQKNRPKEMDMCRAGIVEAVAFLAKEEMLRHKERIAEIKAEKAKYEQEAAFDKTHETRLGHEIEELSHSMVNTSEVVKLINAELLARNFHGFFLREKPGMTNYYELVRDGNVIAKGLSEGERHFFSFLFFYHQVMGSTSEDGEVAPKIVIIDDPVCSLDSETFFAVGSMVRRMVEICRRNVDLESKEETFIKQFFCLSHNPVFLKDVSKPYLWDYENCSFFEVTKDSNNSSKVSVCEMEVKEQLGRVMKNRFPVENTYDAMWNIVRDSKEIYPLLNAAQTILEQDFVVHGGMVNGKLAEELLVNRASDLIDKETGDMTVYNIVDTLISTFGATQLMKHDSIHFDIKAVDPDQIREAFHLVYTMMRQEEHYKAMMG